MLALLLSAFAAEPVVLTTWLAETRTSIDALDATTCEPVLQGVYDDLRPLTPEQVDLADATVHAEALLDGLFGLRVAMQDGLRRIEAAGELDEGCVTAARRADLAGRYLADHVYAVAPHADPWRSQTGFRGIEDLRAGDLLLTRGDQLSSAGIAHMGQVDSQFSHNAMVHVDADGKLWTIEAYLEKGAHTQPVEDFLQHGLGRIVVVRFEDPALAARGAALAFDRVRNGAPIPYDEAFDGDDPSELFCSEVGPWAIAMAGGPTDIPRSRTVFPQAQNPDLFRQMGVSAHTLPAPADPMFDPRFQLVAEWRNVDQLDAMWRQDAVVESVFTWMEAEGYALTPTWANRATVDVGLAVRRTPVVGGLLSERLHPQGDRQFLVAGLALQQAGTSLAADFDAAVPPGSSWDAQKAALDELRDADLATWRESPRSAGLHRVLAPAR
jgi:hypothetical protein